MKTFNEWINENKSNRLYKSGDSRYGIDDVVEQIETFVEKSGFKLDLKDIDELFEMLGMNEDGEKFEVPLKNTSKKVFISYEDDGSEFKYWSAEIK